MDLTNIREDYRKAKLTRQVLLPDPFDQFEKWMNEAFHAQVSEPNAMTLATATPLGAPSLRTVLLKTYDRRGMVFFTNYGSRKSLEIGENPQVALLFSWLDLERQIIIEGQAARIPAAESLQYFTSRPRGSQIGAWCSPQSSRITSRRLLLQEFAKMREKFEHGEIPLPSFWGGYRVEPRRFEFWQGRTNRLHDRFEYLPEKEKGTWAIHRLAP